MDRKEERDIRAILAYINGNCEEKGASWRGSIGPALSLPTARRPVLG